jgi:adhesin transport system membrane fusion protein
MNAIDQLLLKPRFVIYTILCFVLSVLIWSYFSSLDQVVIGEGKIKPRTDIQEIQSLEGGIVREVMVKTGEQVEKGQPLIRLDDIAFKAALNEQLQEMDNISGSIAQLQAELEAAAQFNDTTFKANVDINKYFIEGLSQESKDSSKASYTADLESLQFEASTIRKRMEQSVKDVAEAQNNLIGLKDNLKIAQEELNLNMPAYEKGAISGVEILKLKRAVNDTKAELDATRYDIDRKRKDGQEAKLELSSLVAKFRSEVQEKLNGKRAELSQLQANNTAIQDKVQRTVVVSPVEGIVKSVFANTSGGVIQPGATMIEIVPFDKEMLVEVKITPQDIAFIKIGLPALVKLSAYDFVIYGGISGELTHISADTIQDEEGNAYYMGYVSLPSMVSDSGHFLEIIPGMQASVDIIAGSKTIMQYWLKPILRAQASAMREM